MFDPPLPLLWAKKYGIFFCNIFRIFHNSFRHFSIIRKNTKSINFCLWSPTPSPMEDFHTFVTAFVCLWSFSLSVKKCLKFDLFSHMKKNLSKKVTSSYFSFGIWQEGWVLCGLKVPDPFPTPTWTVYLGGVGYKFQILYSTHCKVKIKNIKTKIPSILLTGFTMVRVQLLSTTIEVGVLQNSNWGLLNI